MKKAFNAKLILQLHSEGMTQREIAAAAGCAKQSVTDTIRAAAAYGSVEELLAMTEEEVYATLFPDRYMSRQSKPQPDYAAVHYALACGSSMYSVHKEYKKTVPDGYARKAFTDGYDRYAAKNGLPNLAHANPAGTLNVFCLEQKVSWRRKENEVICMSLVAAEAPVSGHIVFVLVRNDDTASLVRGVYRLFEAYGVVPEKAVLYGFKSRGSRVCKGLKELCGVVASKGQGDEWKLLADRIIGAFSEMPYKTYETFSRDAPRVLSVLNRDVNPEFAEAEKHRCRPFIEDLESVLPKSKQSNKYIVDVDCHIRFEWNFYSVPSMYQGEKVAVQFTDEKVYIYSAFDGADPFLVAVHSRFPVGSYGQYCTDPAHMPSDYDVLVAEKERPTPYYLSMYGYFIKAQVRGEAVRQVVEKYFDAVEIEQQAFRRVRALLSIGGWNLDRACRLVLDAKDGDISVKTIKKWVDVLDEKDRIRKGKKN